MSGNPPVHDHIKPLEWLLGTWHSADGCGYFPTITEFKYEEELHFSHIGQPNIQFSANAKDPETKKPLHREVGFIRIKPGTSQVAWIAAQNLGVCELEEGEVHGQEMTTESHTVGRLTFGKEPITKRIARTFRRNGNELEQIVSMETNVTSGLHEHLKVRYKLV